MDEGGEGKREVGEWMGIYSSLWEGSFDVRFFFSFSFLYNYNGIAI